MDAILAGLQTTNEGHATTAMILDSRGFLSSIGYYVFILKQSSYIHLYS